MGQDLVCRIPTELRSLPQWVVWRRGPTDAKGKFKKVPLGLLDGQPCSVADPASWGTIERAVRALEACRADGLGFIFTAGDPFVGIDLDHCVRPDGGIDDWAADIVALLSSYAEVSPSGLGIKIFVKGTLPTLATSKRNSQGPDGAGSVEIYDCNRFFTVTGKALPGAPPFVADCSAQLQELATRLGMVTRDQVEAAGLSDDELLAKARAAANGEKFERLWSGNTDDHSGDHSSADLALCKLLVFWTGGNFERADRLFRQSGLYRSKWGESHSAAGETYGAMTLKKALDGQVEFFGAAAIDTANRLVDKVRETRDPAAVFDSVDVLARLNMSEWGRTKSELKGILESRLNLNDLERAVSEQRLRNVTQQPQTDNGSPTIVVNRSSLTEKSEAALNALVARNVPPKVFVRSSDLVRLLTDPVRGTVRIKTVDEPFLTGLLDRSAKFVRAVERGYSPTDPPRSVVQDILANVSDAWPFPPLRGVVEAPVLRTDGTILEQRGYDSASGLVYQPARGLVVPPIPAVPSQADAAAASRLILDEVLADFPFADDAGRANTLAIMLTIVLRELIDGPVPLAIITAPQAGAGKSLLSEIISMITTGRQSSMVAAPSEEREWEKLIGSLLADGKAILIFDNVDHPINSSSLASAITARTWEHRVLGESRTVHVPVNVTWIANGNNVVVGRDLPRRCYWVRLNPKSSRPHLRSGFRHANIALWVRENRGYLLSALLTMARAWFVAGRPPASLPCLGSFEAWTSVVGGVLAHAGVTGFLANADEMFRQQSDEDAGWATFLRAWHGHFGEQTIIVPHLVSWLKDMSDVLPGYLADSMTEGSLNRRLGKALAKRREQRFGDEGLHLEEAGEARNYVLWRVRADRVTPPAPSEAMLFVD